MIELTDEMRQRLAGALAEDHAVVAASVDAEGQPKLSYYGSAQVYSSDALAIWVRDPNAGLLGRISQNPRMTLMYANVKEKVGWQFYGTARVVDDPDVREAVYDAIHKAEKARDPDQRGVAVVIDLHLVTGRGGVEMRRG